MAISMSAAITQIAALVRGVNGIKHVYDEASNDINRLPGAINEFPAVMVFAGPTLAYDFSNGQQRHTYEIKVQLYEGGPDLGERAAGVVGFVDQIITLMAVNATLGGRVNYCEFRRQSGLAGLPLGAIEYTGTEVVLEVSEQGSQIPATGA